MGVWVWVWVWVCLCVSVSVCLCVCVSVCLCVGQVYYEATRFVWACEVLANVGASEYRQVLIHIVVVHYAANRHVLWCLTYNCCVVGSGGCRTLEGRTFPPSTTWSHPGAWHLGDTAFNIPPVILCRVIWNHGHSTIQSRPFSL